MSDYKMQYTILKEISEVTFTFEFCKILFQNHFFNFYFLKVDISVITSYQLPKFSPPVNNIAMERLVSQIFHLGPSFYSMTKNGQLYAIF